MSKVTPHEERHSLADVLHRLPQSIAWRMCCTAASQCTNLKFSVCWRYICSSRRMSSRLFVQKAVNIFFCTVWLSLICTPAVTNAETNHFAWFSLNQYEWPAVCSLQSSTPSRFLVSCYTFPKAASSKQVCLLSNICQLQN